MGSIFRKTAVRAVPAGATITRNRDGTETAKWMPRAARRSITAPVRTLPDGRKVIQQETGCFYAKYRDPDGLVRTVSTGCRDRSAAEQSLAHLERQSERVKSGVLSRTELSVADHLQSSITRHIQDYASTLGKGRHAKLTRRYLERLSELLGWRLLTDLRRDDLELWLADQARPGPVGKPIRSARSRVGFQTAAVAFCNWLVVVKRLTVNPFARMPKAKIECDRRRIRRALTPAELGRVILAAQNAPERAASHGRSSNGRKGGLMPVRLSGRSRGVLYAFLAQTGIRVGEARKVRVQDLDLDGARPGVYLPASSTKNGEAAFVPLRSDLIAVIREEVASRSPADTVFDLPVDLLRRFYGDLRRAGIPRLDDRGRVIDVHSLRTTFGTSLAVAGVPLATAQKLMRHSDPKLTANIYTDARLLDLHGAVEAMSGIPSVVARVVPTSDSAGRFESYADTQADDASESVDAYGAAKNPTFRRVS